MKLIPSLLTTVVLFTIHTADAALLSRLNGQAVYDTDLNVTWLADANLAASNTFGVSGINANGSMVWNTAQGWISAMNAANYLGYSDWRLPSTLQPDSSCSSQSGGMSYGYNCTGSDIGHLFYNELGGTAGVAISTSHNTNYSLFQNIQDSGYWSGTELASSASLYAWVEGFARGYEGDSLKLFSDYYGLVVRTGDVSAVPVPAAVWLLSSGLIGLVSAACKRKAD